MGLTWLRVLGCFWSFLVQIANFRSFEWSFWFKLDHFFSIKRVAHVSHFPHANIPLISTLKASKMDDPNRFLFPMGQFGLKLPTSTTTIIHLSIHNPKIVHLTLLALPAP
jgi:hypothetical protein